MDQENQDSLGPLTITLDSLARSSRNTNSKRATKAQVAIELARLTAVFGNAKDRTPAMLELMADEWHTALKAYSFEMVHEAVGVQIASRRFWPVIADVRASCELLLNEAYRASEQRKAEEDARRAADRIPDPFEAFSVGVFHFMKRTARRCDDFRNAGVRTVTGVIGLEFDTQADVDMIAARYGTDLDQEFGFHVPLTWATIVPATEWVHPQWKKKNAA